MKITFDTTHLDQKIYKRSIRGGVVSIASEVITTILNLARGAILARLLLPEDYGLQGMLVAPISLALIFKDLGLGTASVREKEISQDEASNLFWANTFIGFISMLIVVACGPLFAWFYNEPRLIKMSYVLSMAYLFGGLSIQHQSLLRRQMLFERLAVVSICSNLASSSIAVMLAYYGARYWALVWLLILTNLFLAFGFWIATGWIPRLPSRHTSIRRLFKVGRDVASLNIFGTLSKQIDKIALGKLAGAYELGLYNRAFMVTNLVSNQLRMSLFSVAFPAMSAIQSRSKEFKIYYLKFAAVVAHISMPLASFFFCFADKIILIYLGMNWSGAIPFLRILAIGAFFTPVITSLDQIPLVLGYSELYRNTGIFRNIVLVSSILLGLVLFGAIGAAIGVAISNLISLPIFLPWVTTRSPIAPSNFIRTISAPAVISTLTVCSTEFSKILFRGWKHQPLISLAIFCTVYLFSFVVVDLLKIGSDLQLIRKVKTSLLDRR